MEKSLRITTNESKQGSVEEIRNNGEKMQLGKEDCKVVWNSIVGASFKNTKDYKNYLRTMFLLGLKEGDIEFVSDSIVIKKAVIKQ